MRMIAPSVSRSRRGRLFPAPLWLVVVAGCSAHASCGKRIDTKKGEKVIADRFTAETGLPLKATCPTGVKLGKDVAFDCITSVEGIAGKVHVVQTDDEGNVSFQFTEGYVIGAEVEASIVTKLTEATKSAVTASCGDKVRASVPGTFTCTAKDVNGNELPIEVTINDRVGSIDWKAAPPPAPPPAVVE